MKKQDFWDEISKDYNSFYRSEWSEKEDLAVSTWLSSPKVAGRVLDVGCGTGYAGKMLSQCGVSLVGLDASREMLDLARDTRAYVELHCHDLDDGSPEFLGEFDAIVSTWGSLNYLQNPLGSLTLLTSLLRPGGLIAIMVFNRWSLRRLLHRTFAATEAYGTRGSTRIPPEITLPTASEWKATLSECDIGPVSVRTLGALSGLVEKSYLWPIDSLVTRLLPVGHMCLIKGEKDEAQKALS